MVLFLSILGTFFSVLASSISIALERFREKDDEDEDDDEDDVVAIVLCLILLTPAEVTFDIAFSIPILHSVDSLYRTLLTTLEGLLLLDAFPSRKLLSSAYNKIVVIYNYIILKKYYKNLIYLQMKWHE
jgi:hypothetical protein